MTTAAPTPPAPDPVQLRLPPPPGYCTAAFCTNRLSVLDVAGLCLECQEHPLPPVVNPCPRCKVNERHPGDAYCQPCRTAVNRNAENKRKQRTYRKPLNLPCACCGKAPRHNGGSYCAKCGSDYQAERQKKRAQRQPAASPDGARVSGGGRG